MKSIIIFVVFLTILSFSPFFVQYAQTPSKTTYTWWHGEFPDYYLYLSFIHQGRAESHLTSTYTSEQTPQTGIYDTYLYMGKIGKIFPLSDIQIYYISMVLGLMVFILCASLLCMNIFSGRWYFLSLAMIFLSSPFPDWTIPIINLPIGTGGWTKMDLFSRISHVPHHMISMGLVLAASYMYIHHLSGKKRSHTFLVDTWIWLSILFLCTSIWVFALPGSVFLLSCMLSFFLLLYQKQYLHASHTFILLVCGGVMMGFAWYQLHLAGWAPWEYEFFKAERYPYLFSIFLSSYGILPYLSLPFFIQTIRRPSPISLFITCMAILPLFLYGASLLGIISIAKVRYMYTAPYAWMGISSVLSMQIVFSSSFAIKHRRVLILCLSMCFISLHVVDIYQHLAPKFSPMPLYHNIYIPDEYMQIASYLDAHAVPFSHMMAPYEVATFFPSFAKIKVYAGHPYAFYEHPEKRDILDRWYRGSMSKEETVTIIQKEHIQYILWRKSVPIPSYYHEITYPVIENDVAILFSVL